MRKKVVESITRVAKEVLGESRSSVPEDKQAWW